MGFFFYKLGKNPPKSHWEWGLISAPETPEKNPCKQAELTKKQQQANQNQTSKHEPGYKHVSTIFSVLTLNCYNQSCHNIVIYVSVMYGGIFRTRNNFFKKNICRANGILIRSNGILIRANEILIRTNDILIRANGI